MNWLSKKYKLLILCSVIIFSIALAHHQSYAVQPEQIVPSQALLTIEGQPTKALVDLLGKLNVKHDGMLNSIKTATQQAWLRPAGLEREESPEIYPDKRHELMPLFKDLGLIDAVQPCKKEYARVAVFSNMVASSRQRLAFAYTLWKQGVDFKELHLIGSERELHPHFESAQVLLDINNPDLPVRKKWQLQKPLPTTETPMLELIYDQAKFSHKFRAIPMFTLTAPNQARADGTITRATTVTQVQEWLKQYPTGSDQVLWVSNNPYVAYQDSVVRTYIPSTNIETVGPAADTQKPNFNQDCLDTVARIIYQESIRREKSPSH